MEEFVCKYIFLSLEKEMANHSYILACEIPWTEEPGCLKSMGLQRVSHDLATKKQHFSIAVSQISSGLIKESLISNLAKTQI